MNLNYLVKKELANTTELRDVMLTNHHTLTPTTNKIHIFISYISALPRKYSRTSRSEKINKPEMLKFKAGKSYST
jgi:hypothetical protein